MLSIALLLQACTGTTDKPATDGDADTDTDADTDADTDGDTDADTDADTDTKDTGPDDTGDDPVAIDTGYVGPTVVVMVVDGASGSGTEPSSVVLYDPGTETTTVVSGLTVRADAVPDCAGDSVWVLETRTPDGSPDRILRVSPAAGTYTEWSLGNNFQPADIVAVGPGFWVAAAGKPRLLTYADDGTAGSFVNLADYADADGIPEANGVLFSGGLVYATLGRRGQTDGSYNGAELLAIDPETYAVSATGSLAARYPSGHMLVGGDALYVHARSTPNSDGSLNDDGGIESVTVADLSSNGLVVDDSASGVTETAVALDPFNATAWLALLDSGAPQVAAYSLFDGAALQRWPVGDQVAGIGYANGLVWTGENPFSGEDGALVGRSPTDGTESVRVAQTGRVRSLQVCAGGAAPDGGGQQGQ